MFLVLSLFLCRDGIFAGRVLMPLGGDHVYSVYSAMAYFRHWTHQGEFPLWNPLVMCGHPFGINSETFVNLFLASAVLFKVDTAYNLVTIMSTFLNGVFLYFFLRRHGVTRYGAGLGGFIWMFLSARELGAGFFFLPLALLLGDIYVKQRGARSFLLLTLGITLYALNANPQHAIYGGLLVLVYLIYASRGSSESWTRRFFLIFLPFLLAAGLAMFYGVRLLELAALSNRSSWDHIQMLLPTHFLQAIFPRIFESPTRPELDFMVQRILQGIFASLPRWEIVQRFISFPYVGLFPLVGALIVLVSGRKGPSSDGYRLSRFFLWTVLVVLVYLTLHPIFYFLIERHVPLLGGMHNVNRALFIYGLSLAIVAAVAMDRLLKGRREISRAVKGIATFLLVLLGILLSLFLIARWLLAEFPSFFRGRIISHLGVFERPSIFIESPAAFAEGRVEDFFTFFHEMLSFTNPHLLLPLGALSFLLWFLYLHGTGRIKTKTFKPILALFIVLDLGAAYGFALPSSHPHAVRPYEDVAEFIKRDKGLYRVMLLEDKTMPFREMFMGPQSNMTYGIATPDGYEQLYLKRYVRFHRLLTRAERDALLLLHPRDGFDESLADFLNCRYILTSSSNSVLEGRPGYEKIFDQPPYRVYQNQDALERFFIVHNARVMAGTDEVEAYLRRFPGKLGEEVLLEAVPESPSQPGPKAGDHVEVLQYGPDKIDIRAGLQDDGYLVMSEVFFPGWRATVDGERTRIELANYAFRAIPLAEGSHRVSLVYDPSSLRIGNAIALGFLVALVLFTFSFRKIFPRRASVSQRKGRGSPPAARRARQWTASQRTGARSP